MLNTEQIFRFTFLYIGRGNLTQCILKAGGDRIFVLNTQRIIRFILLCHRREIQYIFGQI